MLTNKPLSLAMIGLTCSWIAGCSEPPPPQAQNSAGSNPATATQAQAMGPNQGRVLETVNSGGYTYVKVEQNGNRFWLAGAGATVSVGEVIRWGQAALMENFTSKSLNRSFDKIYFVSSLAGSTQSVHSTVNLSQPATAPKDSGRVLSSISSGGYTYVQVSTADGDIWLAAPKFRVNEGDLVRWNGASTMHNFTSKSLNRTFETILFAAKAQTVAGGNSAPAAETRGQVISAQESGGYTYIQVDTTGGEKWIAVPSTPVSVGDQIAWNGASVMNDFTSKSLNRTFKEILFAGSVTALN